MGAQTFYTKARGKSAEDAFQNAVGYAMCRYGSRGYTGSIKEKGGFTKIRVPKDRDPEKYAEELIENDDKRTRDKWGPAGCIELKKPKIDNKVRLNVENNFNIGEMKNKYKLQALRAIEDNNFHGFKETTPPAIHNFWDNINTEYKVWSSQILI